MSGRKEFKYVVTWEEDNGVSVTQHYRTFEGTGDGIRGVAGFVTRQNLLPRTRKDSIQVVRGVDVTRTFTRE